MAPFKEALREVWAEPIARQFTLFVFVSMLGYGAQDLVLEPFAGAVFGFTPGESTTLSPSLSFSTLLPRLAITPAMSLCRQSGDDSCGRARGRVLQPFQPDADDKGLRGYITLSP